MIRPLLILINLLLSVGVTFGSFRDHQEFRVSSVKTESSKLIENVNQNRWIALNLKGSALSVTVSMSKNGVYSVVFLTRYESIKNVNIDLISSQTINFVPIPAAEITSKLNSKGVLLLEKAINHRSTLNVVCASTYDGSGKPVKSIQKVSCEVFSKKEVHELIIAYFSNVDQEKLIWEDSN